MEPSFPAQVAESGEKVVVACTVSVEKSPGNVIPAVNGASGSPQRAANLRRVILTAKTSSPPSEAVSGQ